MNKWLKKLIGKNKKNICRYFFNLKTAVFFIIEPTDIC